ncbi:hypothetical protein HDK77DRAFT_5076 [Phyllosticta capitalensis]
MSTQNHSSLHMHIEDPQSKATTGSQSNGSWSIEAKIGLVGLVLAVVIPLIGFIMRKRLWPSIMAIMDRASHGSQAAVPDAPEPSSSSSSPTFSVPDPLHAQLRNTRLRQRLNHRRHRHVRRSILPFFELDSDLEDLHSNSMSSRTKGPWRSVTTILNTVEYTEPDTIELRR